MIKLIDILNEIKINVPINRNIVEKMLNFINKDVSGKFDFQDYKKITRNIEYNLGIDLLDYIPDEPYSDYDFSTMSNEQLRKIFNIVKPHFEEKNINISQLDEIKINQPIRINADLVSKMMNFVDRTNILTWDDYFAIKNMIKYDIKIDISDYNTSDGFNFSGISNENLKEMFNIIKPYLDKAHKNIKDL